MKDYGMILADNGSSFFFSGSPDSRWNDNDLHNLDTISSKNFEVVQMPIAFPGYDANTAPTGAAPTVSSFTFHSGDDFGLCGHLSWIAMNDTYDYIDNAGPSRKGSIVVHPTATTIYTLNSSNAFGRTTKSFTVVVH